MKTIIGLLIATLAFLQLAGAQPGPGQPPAVPPNRQPKVAARVVRDLLSLEQKAIVQSTPRGVFVLRNGVLAQLDPQTLQPKTMLDLFPPVAPAAPRAPFATAPEIPNVERMYPASLLLLEDDLLILIGDRLFRVDAAAGKLRYDADLSGPFGQAANRWRELVAPPALELKGDILYIVRATQMCAVDVREGKLLRTVLLPTQMQQANIARAPQARQDRPANQPPPEPPREVTLVGVMLKQQDGAKTLWTLSTADNTLYLLEGDTLDKLLAAPNPEGIRTRITGTLRVDDNLPDFAEGRLEIKEFQILPD